MSPARQGCPAATTTCWGALLLLTCLAAVPVFGRASTTSSKADVVSGTSKDNGGLRINGRCELIASLSCADGSLPYNATIMPNSLGHQRLETAELEVSQFWPLMEILCSPDLRLFLCSLYFPVCTSTNRTTLPCRNRCLSARTGCQPLMLQYGFQWPDHLDCGRFPEECGEEPCVGGTACPDNTGQWATFPPTTTLPPTTALPPTTTLPPTTALPPSTKPGIKSRIMGQLDRMKNAFTNLTERIFGWANLPTPTTTAPLDITTKGNKASQEAGTTTTTPSPISTNPGITSRMMGQLNRMKNAFTNLTKKISAKAEPETSAAGAQQL